MSSFASPLMPAADSGPTEEPYYSVVDRTVAAHSAQGISHGVYNLGIGERRLPPHPGIRKLLSQAAKRTEHAQMAIEKEDEEHVCGLLTRRLGITSEKWRLFTGGGSLELIRSILCFLPGDVLLPLPSWLHVISRGIPGDRGVIPLYLHPETAYLLTPELLEQGIRVARGKGADPRILLLNFPSDPTGQTYSLKNLQALARIAGEYGLTVISDELHSLFEMEGYHTSFASVYPEHTIVTLDITHHFQLPGAFFAAALVPSTYPAVSQGLMEYNLPSLLHSGNTVFSGIRAILQHKSALSEQNRLAASVQHSVTSYLADRLLQFGASLLPPEGPFHSVYVDFSFLRDRLLGHYGVRTSNGLASLLLTNLSVLTLPGVHFGDLPEHLRLKLAAADYDGAYALKYAKEQGIEDTDRFIRLCCPRLVEGLNRIIQFLTYS